MNYKLAIIDKRSPRRAIDELSKYVDDMFLFGTEAVTYNSISCHPDIFVFQDKSSLVVAPNAPTYFLEWMTKYNLNFTIGKTYVGERLNNSTQYNCVCSRNHLFHKNGFTDESILKKCASKKIIDLPQAYTRCSLIHIGNNNFITSDKGIEKKLLSTGFNCFYFDPIQIRIQDHRHGFFGGSSGMLGDKLFTIGNVEKHSDGAKLLKFLDKLEITAISLCDDFLYDGGGLFFMQAS